MKKIWVVSHIYIYLICLICFSTSFPAQAAPINPILINPETNLPGQPSDYTLEFNLPGGFDAGLSGEFDLSFSAEFDLSAITVTDIDLSFNSIDIPVVSTPPAAGEIKFSPTGNIFNFQLGNALSLAPGQTVRLKIGTIASGGTNRILNPPVSGSYYLEITSYQSNYPTGRDSGQIGFTINDDTNVIAEVMTNLTFTINGVLADNSCPNGGHNAEVSSSGNEINFGQFFGAGRRLACQQIIVSSNATNGYTVTVEQNRDLTSAGGDIINKFAGGTGFDNTWLIPEVWNSPVSPNRGYFGFNTDDIADFPQFSGNKFAAFITDDTEYTIISEPDIAMDETNYVNYMVEVNDWQASGLYSNTVRYVCTAVF